jgi:hypothetical protein
MWHRKAYLFEYMSHVEEVRKTCCVRAVKSYGDHERDGLGPALHPPCGIEQTVKVADVGFGNVARVGAVDVIPAGGGGGVGGGGAEGGTRGGKGRR